MEQGTLTVRDFDLALTLASGQMFRYKELGRGEFLLLTQGHAILVRQPTSSTLEWSGAPRALVTRLFSLDEESDAAHLERLARLSADPKLRDLVPRYRGMRLMRIDPHETILGFICSAMSNIPKIRKSLDGIASTMGLPHADGTHHRLPLAGTDLDEQALRATGVGYRAAYLRATNKLLTQELLTQLSSSAYHETHALLCALPGVGPKVADCVCIVAYGHGAAFPVDVHVHRAMLARFPRSRLSSERKSRDFAQHRWKEDSAHAQQILFQWARDNLSSRNTR
jgi:N-glycosylase/DNA lyase